MYQIEDVNRDRRIDLSDVILTQQGLAGSAEEPGNFVEKAKLAIGSMQAVVGLKTTIQSHRDTAPGSGLFSDQPMSLTAYEITPVSFPVNLIPDETYYHFNSIDKIPPTPPPKTA